MNARLPFSRRYVPLALPRRWIRDLLFFASKAKVCGGSYVINVRQLAERRRVCHPRIGWSAIFVRAIALSAKRHPELRRSYMPFPWPHFYEHPFSVACMVVERPWQGEPAVFFDRIRAPERQSLQEIDCAVRGLKTLPVEAIGGYRLLIRITRYPFLLRRLIWRIALYGSGRLRARYFGTFSVNSIPARNVATTQSTTPLAVSFFYGVVDREGNIPIQAFFNHYITDGAQMHRLLSTLTHILNHEILDEISRGTTTEPPPGRAQGETTAVAPPLAEPAGSSARS